jgi:hypothetical protein
MYEKKKRIFMKPIVFDYRSLNPFALVRKDECNCSKKGINQKLNDENEWRLEYELIYRSYQLER